MNVCLFCAYVYVTRERLARRVPLPAHCAAVLAVGLSTAHIAIGLSDLVWDFVSSSGTSGGPSLRFADVSAPASVSKVAIRVVNSFLSGAIIVSIFPFVFAGKSCAGALTRELREGLEVLARVVVESEDMRPARPDGARDYG